MERIHFTLKSINGDTGTALCTMSPGGAAPLGETVVITDPTQCMLHDAVPGLCGIAEQIDNEWVVVGLQCPPEV